MNIKEFIFHVCVLILINVLILLSRPTTVTAGVVVASILGYCIGGMIYRKYLPKLRKKRVK